MRYVVFFNYNKGGHLQQFGHAEMDSEKMETNGTILQLLYQKRHHKNAFINHEVNEGKFLNPVRVLGCQ